MKKLSSRGFKSKAQVSMESDKGRESSSMLEQIEEELATEGIVPFDNSSVLTEYLRLPADLTEEPSKELGRYFTAFTTQKAYVRTMIGKTGAILREENEKLDEIRETVYKELPSKMAIKEKELAVRAGSGKAENLLRECAKLEEKKKMLCDYLESLTDILFCISREVSRRENDWAEDKREHNLGNKRRG